MINAYFNNADSSFPKPSEVAEKVAEYLSLTFDGKNADKEEYYFSQTTDECRALIAKLIKCNDTGKIFFMPDRKTSCRERVYVLV